MKIMWTGNKEEDYFIPPLAPYVQWVKAYNQLVCLLYSEHKTVARTWKAFRKAVPGIEGRLEFGAFEQILLFSLFLAEWNKSEKSTAAGQIHESEIALGKVFDERLEEVTQELRRTIDQRDRALWNIKNYERDALALKERSVRLESQASELDKALRVAKEQLEQVTHELDNSRAEIESLREENAAIKFEKALLEEQVKKLGERSSDWPPVDGAGAVEAPQAGEEPVQAVTHGGRQASEQAVTQRTPGSARTKIGGWNVQLSKDGYYRLFRKIRGKVYSIYIGKELDIEKAEMRIADKERKLLGQG
ncbi:MAG: hypothetical protein P4L55_18740 [Syntrophobacteraceae bacterium]|nr:hypothetical protein [Syntrophobacteraceae bacterium]